MIKNINSMFFVKILFFLFLSFFASTRTFAEVSEFKKSTLDIDYLNLNDELKDYILDTGDELYIQFENIPELSKIYKIDTEGKIFFNRIKEAYVRGLTTSELEVLLEQRFKEFLLDPKIYIKIINFKPIRVVINGEVKTPGFVVMKSSKDMKGDIKNGNFDLFEENNKSIKRNPTFIDFMIDFENDLNSLSLPNDRLIINDNKNAYTLSNAIKMSGGLTPYSDVTNIEIIRDNSIGEGGGKIRTFVDLTDFLEGEFSTNQDIRLFDGDSINIPRLSNPDKRIVLKSVLSGLSPKYIKVYVSGKTSNPGTYLIPLEGTLSDAMNLSGPNIPFSGKVYLISYNRDGSLSRAKIKYSLSAKPGSSKNPFLKSGDYITIQESSFGRFSRTIKLLTDPIRGIYISKELFEDIF